MEILTHVLLLVLPFFSLIILYGTKALMQGLIKGLVHIQVSSCVPGSLTGITEDLPLSRELRPLRH